jgi:hypothetical protein
MLERRRWSYASALTRLSFRSALLFQSQRTGTTSCSKIEQKIVAASTRSCVINREKEFEVIYAGGAEAIVKLTRVAREVNEQWLSCINGSRKQRTVHSLQHNAEQPFPTAT